MMNLMIEIPSHDHPPDRDLAAEPAVYAIEMVSTAATGRAMNAPGQVAGVRQTLPPGCTPSTCAPVAQAVVWSGDAVASSTSNGSVCSTARTIR